MKGDSGAPVARGLILREAGKYGGVGVRRGTCLWPSFRWCAPSNGVSQGLSAARGGKGGIFHNLKSGRFVRKVSL